MRGTRRRLRAWLIGGLILGGMVGSAAWAGWPFAKRTIPGDQFVTGPVKLTIYDRMKAVEERTFAADSPEVKALKGWLVAHPRDWSVDFNSYAPQGRRLEGKRFNLNIGTSHVILNYQFGARPEQWTQVSRAIEPGEVPAPFGPPRAQ